MKRSECSLLSILATLVVVMGIGDASGQAHLATAGGGTSRRWTDGNSLVSPVLTANRSNETSSTKFDEYGAACPEDEKARLDNFAIEVQKNPGQQMWIVVYGGRCVSDCIQDYPRHRSRYPRRGEAQKRGDRAKAFLVEYRGMTEDQITVIDAGFRESFTIELWLGPKGESRPQITPTVQAKTIEYRKGKATNREFRVGCK